MAISRDVYKPVVGLVIRLIVLGLVYWILTGLPMIKELTIPRLPISTGALVSVIIGIIMIAMFLTFKRDFAPRFKEAVPAFPESETIVKSGVNIIVITIAYTMFDEAIIPFMKQYSWAYPIFFVLIAIWPLCTFISTLYKSSDKIADLATGKIAEASGELVKCDNCGELITSAAVYCPMCSVKLDVQLEEVTAVKCGKCGAENRADGRFCLACGKPLGVRKSLKAPAS